MATPEKSLASLVAPGEDASEESGDEKKDAAQDVLDALGSKDAQALSLALERHYELCAHKAEG